MYLAVDIGGTKTLFALFSKRGRILRKVKIKTPQGLPTFCRAIKDNLTTFKKYHIKSVVVAAPGVVQKNCSVRFGNRNWGDAKIIPVVQEVFDCPVYLENDANLATLYEGYNLSGKVVFLTFSTGIGGGIVEKNKILAESKKLEPGHKKYVYDGVEKEWEDIAAARAIENYYHIDRATNLRKKEALEDVAKRVYLGLPDIVKKYKPNTIILGGPLGKLFKFYKKYLPKDLDAKLRAPKRPSESVVYGCYLYAKQKEQE